jgi:hypothetical protein
MFIVVVTATMLPKICRGALELVAVLGELIDMGRQIGL